MGNCVRHLCWLLLVSFIFMAGCSEEQTVSSKQHKTKTTAPAQKYSLNFSHVIHPDTDAKGAAVYFSTLTAGKGSQLIHYDLKSKTSKVISESEYQEGILQHIKSNDKWLIWLDSTPDAAENKIYALNKETGEKTVVSESDPRYVTADAPVLYEDYVAWVFLETVDEKPVPMVKVLDLENKKVKVVSELNDYGLYNNFVHMDHDWLVWTDHVDGKGFYHLYNLKTNEKKKIEAPFKYPGYAMISGDKIFALHFPDATVWNEQEFGYYDLKTEKYQPFFQDKRVINLFRLSGDKLAVLDDEGKMKNYIVNERGISENKELTVHEAGVENIHFSSRGELIYTYSSHPGLDNTLVIVK